MKLVKLIAKPNTWFKEGTEVYNHDGLYFTLDQYEDYKKQGMILVKGTRVCENEEFEYRPIGEEYIDRCIVDLNGFEVEFIKL